LSCREVASALVQGRESGRGNMLDRLSDDTILHIVHHATIKERARMSSLNKRLHKLLHEWSDISHITAHKNGLVFASNKFLYEYTGRTPLMSPHTTQDLLCSALRQCVYIRKLVVSNVQMIKNISIHVFAKLVVVEDLTLPSDLFNRRLKMDDTIMAILSLKKLTSLKILQRYDSELKSANIFHIHHAQSIQAPSITKLKLQGVSVTPDAFEAIALKYSDTLNELCLIGVLVHTPDAASYFESLSRFKVISTLSLPPSLYSLSAEPAIREFNVVHLLPIRHLSVFVYQPEIVECRFLLRKLVPETLNKLCLHDASGVLMKHFAPKEFRGLHFEVKFCRRRETLLEKDWMMGYCDLLSHMVW
uniref:F-box domain-containing protein n=3 Tax=Parascaris univalens TaxID=6257 RepID=A0A915A422_PARUN